MKYLSKKKQAQDFAVRSSAADARLVEAQKEFQVRLVAMLFQRGDGVVEPVCRWIDVKPSE